MTILFCFGFFYLGMICGLKAAFYSETKSFKEFFEWTEQ